MVTRTAHKRGGANGISQQHALFDEVNKRRTSIVILLTLVGLCSAATFAAKDHGGYECDERGRENRYPDRGTKPGEIQISGANMCSGSGAVFSASGGYDCDNQMLGESQSWGSHSTGCSNANCFYKICILEWNNNSAPYAWFVSGPVDREEMWSSDAKNLNDRTYIRSHPGVVDTPLPFTVTVTRSECTHAIELGGEPITNQWHGTVTTPPKLQRTARVHPDFDISADDVRNNFRAAGLILRTDNDGRAWFTPQPQGEWRGNRDHSQCVEFELYDFLDDDEAPQGPVYSHQVQNEMRAGGKHANVTYTSLAGGVRGYGTCPGTRERVLIDTGAPISTLVHEWGHNGNIAHPNGDPGYPEHDPPVPPTPAYPGYTQNPDLYANDVMLYGRPDSNDWIIGIYGKCEENEPLKHWTRQRANALKLGW